MEEAAPPVPEQQPMLQPEHQPGQHQSGQQQEQESGQQPVRPRPNQISCMLRPPAEAIKGILLELSSVSFFLLGIAFAFVWPIVPSITRANPNL